MKKKAKAAKPFYKKGLSNPNREHTIGPSRNSDLGNYAARKSRQTAQLGKQPAQRALPLHIEPLPATFSLIGMLGFIITTVFTVSGRVPLSWGVAFDIVFALMFIASMISITPKFAGWD